MDLLSGVIGHSLTDPELRPSEFVETRLLNPQIPRAIKNDPEGKYHFERHVSDRNGDPIPNIRRGQLIPLALRPYQAEALDAEDKNKAYRWSRRSGKTFLLALEAVVEALTNPSAMVLVVTPAENQVKVIFDDYIRPLLYDAYRHRNCADIGIQRNANGRVPDRHDFVITRDTQKPQEIVVENDTGHRASIKGMVVSSSARGQSATVVIVDESDFAKDAWLRAVVVPIQSTSAATKMIVSSTPSGSRESFFYEACTGPDFREFRVTFRQLPHWSEEREARVARLVGGKNTNTFKQEFLAEWGELGQGLFNQQALNASLIIAPYIRVLEDVDRATGERRALLTDAQEVSGTFCHFRRGADRFSNDVPYDKIGAQSIWHPGIDPGGVITAGTDWNEHAGMQTVIIWWPSLEFLRSGQLKVARFEYDHIDPLTGARAQTVMGGPKEFTVGSTNGDPAGLHDLSATRGIVIWHGRLEQQQGFNWLLAANRAAAIMGIPNFIDAWYVDHGYGRQVIQKIMGIIKSGEYDADHEILRKHHVIDPQVVRHMEAFDPEMEGFPGAKIFKPIDFGSRIEWVDPHGQTRKDSVKELLYELAPEAVLKRRLLFPASELYAYASDRDLGEHVFHEVGDGGFTETGRRIETNRDMLRPNGLAEPKGVNTTNPVTFGGLVAQCRSMSITKVRDGRRIYEGIDHGVDGLALAVYAYEENFAKQHHGSILRPVEESPGGVADEMWDTGTAVVQGAPPPPKAETKTVGGVRQKMYKGDASAPLQEITSGRKTPEEVGISMEEFARQANRFRR